VRLRLLPVLGLALLALGALAGSSSSATAPPTIDPFIGDWTMTSDGAAALAGYHLVIKASNASEAKSLVGPEWVNQTETAWYDSHCGSKATVYGYVVLTYTWPTPGSMGGCISNKTGPHIIFAGSQKEAGSVRIANATGLDELQGTWDTIENHICCTRHAIVGARPQFDFTVGEQGHRALPKTKNGPKFLLTRLIGLGSVSLLSGTNAGDAVIGDATGTFHFHKWRIFEHGVVDEDLLVLKVQKTGASFVQDRGIDFLQVGVVVTKSEKDETDACPGGAAGTLKMRDGSTEGKKDVVLLKIPSCSVNEAFVNELKGDKVVVKLTYKKP